MVLLAAVALIGSAGAWDDKTWTSYEAGQIAYKQAGDPLCDLIGFESGTYFKGLTPYGEKAGAVFNKLTDETEGPLIKLDNNANPTADTWGVAGSNQITPFGGEPDQTLTLTQSGKAYTIVTNANSADGIPELQAGISTKQNLHFNGYYQGAYPNPAVYATFESEGNAGLPGKAVITSFTNLEHAMGRAQPGMIETDGLDTYFTDADIGMASTADMVAGVKLNAAGQWVLDPVFSGSVTSFAGFSGGRGTGIIEANAGGFENHVMVHADKVWTEGFLPGSYYTSVPSAPDNYFPYW